MPEDIILKVFGVLSLTEIYILVAAFSKEARIIIRTFVIVTVLCLIISPFLPSLS